MREFARLVITWQKESGRHNLPWQKTRDPYARWVSEIMLQQTQVSVVIPYYERFLQDYPDVHALARATEEDVLSHWAGLGYYSRARNMLACAKKVSETGGIFPKSVEELCRLPGIGRSTAGAILSSCWDIPAPIMDGNARRVFCRHFGILRDGSDSDLSRRLWALAEQELPQSDCSVYTQGIMDLGAEVCTRTKPMCEKCPLVKHCAAAIAGAPELFPGAKGASKKKEERTVRFLLLRSNDRIWLSLRTGAGVWRGLWSFPQYLECEQAFGEMLALGLAEEVSPWGRLRHEFTHYSLIMEIGKAVCLAENPSKWIPGRWYSREDLEQGALPAPVKRICLQELLQNQGDQPCLLSSSL